MKAHPKDFALTARTENASTDSKDFDYYVPLYCYLLSQSNKLSSYNPLLHTGKSVSEMHETLKYLSVTMSWGVHRFLERFLQSDGKILVIDCMHSGHTFPFRKKTTNSMAGLKHAVHLCDILCLGCSQTG